MTPKIYEFPYSPHKYQLMVHTALSEYRFVTAVAHRRFGKTECAVASLVIDAIATTKNDAMYGYIAPYLKQAKQIAWRKLKRYVSETFGRDWKAVGIQKNESELWVQLPNGARIQLFGTDNADSIRGLYFDGVVIDEIADMRGEVWNSIIRPTLADRKGWALLIGTPKGMNELYKFYQRGLKDPLWKSLIFSATTTNLPWLPPDEIKALEEDMTESMFAQEMLCDFQASSDDVLFKLSDLDKGVKRQIRLADINGAARVIGLDVAGPGKDKSVMTKLQGLMCWPQQSFKGLTTPELCDVLASQMIQWKADAAIVDNGYGFAVVEQMQRRGFGNVFGVDFGGTPGQPQYANKKTEMIYRTKKWLDRGGKIPNDPELMQEASVHTVKLNDKGKMEVCKKDVVKEIIKRSPDKFDSLIIANAFDVVPLAVRPFQNVQDGANLMASQVMGAAGQAQDYDPYNNES
ncbi:MAG: terminase family protein [Alphaproteobacteria bacterium]|nr:terminase family protein [Alphaproteobacteria bacterium]